MAKSIKLQDDTFLDSTGIVHNKVLLSEILDSLDASTLRDIVAGISTDINRADLNALGNSFIAGYGHNLTNAPSETLNLGHLLSIPRHDSTGFVTQYFSPYTTNDLYIRKCEDGVWGEWVLINKDPYPVGSVVIMDTNTNPNTKGIEGTWELIDKEFKSDTGTTGYKLNTTNCTEITQFHWTRSGHSITLSIRFTNKVQIADTALTMFTVDFATLGITRLLYHYYGYFWSDLATCMGAFNLNATSGGFNTVDIIPDNYISAGRTDNSTAITFNVPKDYMLDSACDKFYWKRTA